MNIAPTMSVTQRHGQTKKCAISVLGSEIGKSGSDMKEWHTLDCHFDVLEEIDVCFRVLGWF